MTSKNQSDDAEGTIRSISAVTLATRDMGGMVRFYRALGFALEYGGEEAGFTSFRIGQQHLNLLVQSGHDPAPGWGRIIFYVTDVDALYERARAQGFAVLTAPRDAEWGERYFHVSDPAGNELSFARPLIRREHGV